MVVFTNPLNVRLGRWYRWDVNSKTSLHFFGSLPVNRFYFDFNFSDTVLDYFVGSIRSFWWINFVLYADKMDTDKFDKKLKSPPILGDCKLVKKSNMLYIYLNYYMDTESLNLWKFGITDLNKVLLSAQRSLEHALGVRINLINFNYYFGFLDKVLFLSRLDYNIGFEYYNGSKILDNSKQLVLDKSGVVSWPYHNKFLFKHARVSYKAAFIYEFVHKKLSRYQKHTYFKRIVNSFMCAFFLKETDFCLILNAIKYELSNLRKKHNLFCSFIFAVLEIFFSFFRKKSNLVGLSLRFKGRLTLYNRETPRSSLKFAKFGVIHPSDLNYRVRVYQLPVPTRYGLVSLKLDLCFGRKETNLDSVSYPSIFIKKKNQKSLKSFSDNASLKSLSLIFKDFFNNCVVFLRLLVWYLFEFNLNTLWFNSYYIDNFFYLFICKLFKYNLWIDLEDFFLFFWKISYEWVILFEFWGVWFIIWFFWKKIFFFFFSNLLFDNKKQVCSVKKNTNTIFWKILIWFCLYFFFYKLNFIIFYFINFYLCNFYLNFYYISNVIYSYKFCFFKNSSTNRDDYINNFVTSRGNNANKWFEYSFFFFLNYDLWFWIVKLVYSWLINLDFFKLLILWYERLITVTVRILNSDNYKKTHSVELNRLEVKVDFEDEQSFDKLYYNFDSRMNFDLDVYTKI